jgi:hypothetical protein
MPSSDTFLIPFVLMTCVWAIFSRKSPLHWILVLVCGDRIDFQFYTFQFLLWGSIVTLAVYCFYTVVHTNIMEAEASYAIARTRPIAHETNRLTPHPHKKHTHHKHVPAGSSTPTGSSKHTATGQNLRKQ